MEHPKVYGVWCFPGWGKGGDERIFHSIYPQVIQAYISEWSDVEMREIGMDGKPVEPETPVSAILREIN